MFSRRTILAWLGLAPAGVAMAQCGLPPIIEAAKAAAPRVRAGWHMRLEGDGSSTLVDENAKRFLDEWLETSYFDYHDEREKVKKIVQEDITAMEMRTKHWEDLVATEKELCWSRDEQFTKCYPAGTFVSPEDIKNQQKHVQKYRSHAPIKFGHSKEDYWETQALWRGKPIDQDEIDRMDRRHGDSYWKPKPLAQKDIPIWRSGAAPTEPWLSVS